MRNIINLAEAKDMLRYILENNKRLINAGKKPTAVELEGLAGVGKTSICFQVAEEMGFHPVKISLAQIEETGDLTGFPIKEYYMCSEDGEKCDWVSADLVPYFIKNGWVPQNITRTSYAPPKWMPRDCDKPILLILDDYTRALPVMIAASMELVNTREFMGWELPKDTQVILSANPDNGEYLTNSVDDAFKSRLMSFNIGFDVKVFARWAEDYGLRSEMINFALMYPEIFEAKNGVSCVNARSFTTFADAVSNLPDLSSTSSLAIILELASACFSTSDNTVGSLFTQFIDNKLDKLPSPEELIGKKWTELKKDFDNCLFTNGVYRADIANVITTRFINHIDKMFSKKGTNSDPICKRLLEVIDSDTVYLTEDLIFNMIKQLNAKYGNRLNKVVVNPKVMAKIL